ncbi:MAG TPA: hypothetical protein VL860_09680 [Planctomycetota bacterium]|nr:hypothetical protein [Planctomycetota bacterium]
MDTRSNPPAFRLVLLSVIALMLVIIVGRKFMEPDPALGMASSPSNNYHLVPTDKATDTKLVLFDSKSKRILLFTVQNSGIRLNGWRDASNDYKLWDTSLVKSNGIETTNGASTQYLLPNPKDEKQPSLASNMEAWLKNLRPPIPIKPEGQ